MNFIAYSIFGVIVLLLIIMLGIFIPRMVINYKKTMFIWKYLKGKILANTKELEGCYGFISYTNKLSFWQLFFKSLGNNMLTVLFKDNSTNKTIGAAVLRFNAILNGKRSNMCEIIHLFFIKKYLSNPVDDDIIAFNMSILEQDVLMYNQNANVIFALINRNNPFAFAFDKANYVVNHRERLNEYHTVRYLKSLDYDKTS